jgi:site-specific DNA-methyltransferase (adenine-specific)
MGSIIWQKVTTCNTTGGATIMGSYPYPRNGIIKLDYEFILIFKKYGNAPNVSKEIKELSKLTNEEWNQYFVGHWNFSGEKQDKHLAMFPEELPKRLIKMFSFVGETILDPFLGSGTTSLAAKKLNRNSIGYEINEDFLQIIKEKLDIDKKEIFNENIYEIIKQSNFDNNYKERINKLPYIFNDPIKFDKKIDPKKFNFGSKIDNTENYKNKFYTVTDIISPEVLILDNQLKIRLLGIKEIFEKRNEAIAFLNEKIYKQKVFIKYDNIKYDENDNLLCYLFLKNGMFINNYLVKKGLADIDEKYNFIYKTKFQNLKNKISIK